MKSHISCLALSLVLPAGSCVLLPAGSHSWRGGEARDPTRMEPFLTSLEGSVSPRDAIPALDLKCVQLLSLGLKSLA